VIVFREQDHSYHNGSEQYRSVSSLIEPYKTFNKEAESLRMALKHMDPEWYSELASKYGYKSPTLITDMLGVYARRDVDEVQEQILAEWAEKGNESRTSGTLFHQTMERADIESGGRINPFTGEWHPLVDVRLKGYDNNSVEFLEDLQDGYYPELLLFNHEQKLCGQADMVFIKDRKIWIDDWKTDAKVDMKSFYTKRYGYTFLKPPLDHVHDTNYWIYALKISCYAWMLEEAGFDVEGTGFTHVGEENKLYRTPYMKDELNKLLWTI